MRRLENVNNLPIGVIYRRLKKLDINCSVSSVKENLTHYAPNGTITFETKDMIEFSSSLEDIEIIPILQIPISSAEMLAEDRRKNSFDQAKLSNSLKTITPEQAVAWIDSSVTNISTTKTALKHMARLLIAMRDEVFPDLPDS